MKGPIVQLIMLAAINAGYWLKLEWVVVFSTAYAWFVLILLGLSLLLMFNTELAAKQFTNKPWPRWISLPVAVWFAAMLVIVGSPVAGGLWFLTIFIGPVMREAAERARAKLSGAAS
ncbi:hypothetical protein [Desulfocurvibacter africanus]|uniref:hypothetical protein n=1 Tax=Desulfocurvibacter africanus TaxID=873 RepID=UPI0004887D49|nr:hypothetical protein [Desulfocurvibacter africanus]